MVLIFPFLSLVSFFTLVSNGLEETNMCLMRCEGGVKVMILMGNGKMET